MDKRLIAVRKRLLTEFPFYAKSALKIRTKEGKVSPLSLNPAQQILQDAIDRQLADEGKDKNNHSESPSAGAVYNGRRLLCIFRVSQNPARKAMVIQSSDSDTCAVYDMTKRYHENCPDILKPHTNTLHGVNCLSMYWIAHMSWLQLAAKAWGGVRR